MQAFVADRVLAHPFYKIAQFAVVDFVTTKQVIVTYGEIIKMQLRKLFLKCHGEAQEHIYSCKLQLSQQKVNYFDAH